MHRKAWMFWLPSGIHVILMDITLPGISGIDALHLIREQYPNKVVIAQTAHSYSEKIANETFDAYIQKPLRLRGT